MGASISYYLFHKKANEIIILALNALLNRITSRLHNFTGQFD